MDSSTLNKNDTMTSTKPGGDDLDEDVGMVATFTAEEEAAVRKKIDLYLIPMLWVMYLFSYADRTK